MILDCKYSQATWLKGKLIITAYFWWRVSTSLWWGTFWPHVWSVQKCFAFFWGCQQKIDKLVFFFKFILNKPLRWMWLILSSSLHMDNLQPFIGSVCRTETMHQLLCFKSKFPNHFAFTLGRYLFLLIWV